LLNVHTGKEGYPTRVYEVTVNHQRRILSCTAGLPGTASDKTVCRSDGFIEVLRSDPLYANLEFSIGSEATGQLNFKGVYLISDAGYPQERLFQAPSKHPSSSEDIVFSARLESVRKDVEDTFGILKVTVTDERLFLWSLFLVLSLTVFLVSFFGGMLFCSATISNPTVANYFQWRIQSRQRLYRHRYFAQYDSSIWRPSQ